MSRLILDERRHLPVDFGVGRLLFISSERVGEATLRAGLFVDALVIAIVDVRFLPCELCAELAQLFRLSTARSGVSSVLVHALEFVW